MVNELEALNYIAEELEKHQDDWKLPPVLAAVARERLYVEIVRLVRAAGVAVHVEVEA